MKASCLVIVVGIALFSMFFGGGNLIFPLWIGTFSGSSILEATLGFCLTGVLLPFLGMYTLLLYKGDYKKIFGLLGPKMGVILPLILLLFWIPLGSGPRCIRLSYSAFTFLGMNPGVVIYGLFYSALVFLLTIRPNNVINVLGYILTPLILASIGVITLASFNMPFPTLPSSMPSIFRESFFSGYQTQDFIGAIFFTHVIYQLTQNYAAKGYGKKHLLASSTIGLALISIVYLQMIYIGSVHAHDLSHISKDQLLLKLSEIFSAQGLNVAVSFAIFASCLSTSVALSLVLADFLTSTFKKLSYFVALLSTTIFMFGSSLADFDTIIGWIDMSMSLLYPITILVMFKALQTHYKTKNEVKNKITTEKALA